MKLEHLIQKLKCAIGWHQPGVYGHVENHHKEVKQILKEDSSITEHYDPKFEYYMCCIACNQTLTWDFRYKLPDVLKFGRFAPMSLGSKEEVYEQ